LSLKGIVVDGEPVDFKDIPDDVLPPEVVNSLIRADRSGLHVSDLQYCLYGSVRQKMYDYYVPVKQIWNITRGNAWDKFIADNGEPDGIYGQEFERTVNGVVVVGTPDIVLPKKKSIRDAKAPGWLPKSDSPPKPYYTWQLNAYRWLVSELFDIDELVLYNCGPHGYLKQQMPVWALDKIDTDMKSRVNKFLTIKDSPYAGDICDDPRCFICYSSKDEPTIWVE